MSAFGAILKPALTLAGFSTTATLALVWSAQFTDPLIAAEHRKDLRRLMQQVVPANMIDNDMLSDVVVVGQQAERSIRYFIGYKAAKPTAIAVQTQSVGYGGPIEMLIGLRPNGTILGVRVTAHKETPGLGDKIESEKSDWIDGFAGKGLGNPPIERWKVTKDGGDFDALTGATITPRAVVRGVRQSLEDFRAYRRQVLALETDDQMENE